MTYVSYKNPLSLTIWSTRENFFSAIFFNVVFSLAYGTILYLCFARSRVYLIAFWFKKNALHPHLCFTSCLISLRQRSSSCSNGVSASYTRKEMDSLICPNSFGNFSGVVMLEKIIRIISDSRSVNSSSDFLPSSISGLGGLIYKSCLIATKNDCLWS